MSRQNDLHFPVEVTSHVFQGVFHRMLCVTHDWSACYRKFTVECICTVCYTV